MYAVLRPSTIILESSFPACKIRLDIELLRRILLRLSVLLTITDCDYTMIGGLLRDLSRLGRCEQAP